MSVLSREQILDIADAAGRKLGFLLSLSPLTEEQKEAVIETLEFATPKQIDKFSEILESSYIVAGNENLKMKFENELGKIKTEFNAKGIDLENETLNKLNKSKQKII